MEHPAVTAHLTKPGQDKAFRDVLANHGCHLAHYLQ